MGRRTAARWAREQQKMAGEQQNTGQENSRHQVEEHQNINQENSKTLGKRNLDKITAEH
jgi:Sec-independent protein translocase protein TatA